jgi:hypothetical protein
MTKAQIVSHYAEKLALSNIFLDFRFMRTIKMAIYSVRFS